MSTHESNVTGRSRAGWAGLTLVAAAAIFAASCGGEAGNAVARESGNGTGTAGATQSGAGDASVAAQARSIDGAGATFPYPVYSQWADQYNKLRGVQLNYQAIGSGGGIAQIKAKTVDFGASDAPLTRDELDEVGLLQFPMIMGGVVPVVHLSGIQPGGIKLTPTLLADIYLGKVKNWSDPAVEKANPGVSLPDEDITVVHRSDGSGTTWIYTNYLDKVSAEWHRKVGTDKAVQWPTGVGGKGNQGVAGYVQRIDGSIGYVEYAYATQNHMTYAQLQNKAGSFVSPTIPTFMSAASNADWEHAPGFYMVLTDQPGANSWPITGASYILVYKHPDDPDQVKEVLKFFDWAYHNGQDAAKKLDYVPIPDNVVQMVEKRWQSDLQGGIWP
ncbi:MAG TPA: phosphate ABC transporter substrate-binding protein PstS [Gemmatimonadota bacterium]|nr:phosphate ABC transporter substrate-binding protein PstS [Gemmatimonadota bacterium]